MRSQRSETVAVMRQFGRYWGQSRHGAGSEDRPLLTHRDISPTLIAASQRLFDHPIGAGEDRLV
jgi:hypothetical protein